jgi:hypothetical protein
MQLDKSLILRVGYIQDSSGDTKLSCPQALTIMRELTIKDPWFNYESEDGSSVAIEDAECRMKSIDVRGTE